MNIYEVRLRLPQGHKQLVHATQHPEISEIIRKSAMNEERI